jgi:nicotinate-nucleotide adenylyltransferase
MSLMRIAVYGGTFDPVHNGHLAVAENLLQQFALDELLFIPANAAPHKKERRVTAPLHRYAMLALATQHDARLCISNIELDAPERPYTIETLSRLKEKLDQKARLFFVMGADSWMEINSWREWERLLKLTDHIVVTRPGYELSVEHVTPEIRERIVELRGRDGVAQTADKSDELKIYVTDAVNMDVSATAIRRLVREGRSQELASFVPPPVADYINKYRLYKDRNDTEFFNQGTGSAP